MTEGEPKPETDVVLFGAEAPADLEPFPVLASRIRPNGAIWVVSRKGKAATLRYEQILDVAKGAGLIDNKVAIRVDIEDGARVSKDTSVLFVKGHARSGTLPKEGSGLKEQTDVKERARNA